MSDFLAKLGAWYQETQIPEQISAVDVTGLFTNPYFLVPFLCLIAYMIYKQAFKYMVLLAIFIGIWAFSGTAYMQEISASDEMPLNKILPLVFGAAAIMGVIVYIFFGRSD